MGKPLDQGEHAVRVLYRLARECEAEAKTAWWVGKRTEGRGLADVAEFLAFAAHHWDQVGVQSSLF